jgi:F0F1-type ATP synthase assembly protein I
MAVAPREESLRINIHDENENRDDENRDDEHNGDIHIRSKCDFAMSWIILIIIGMLLGIVVIRFDNTSSALVFTVCMAIIGMIPCVMSIGYCMTTHNLYVSYGFLASCIVGYICLGLFIGHTAFLWNEAGKEQYYQ